MHYRSPLAQAKAYGSSRQGTSGWLWQRMIALLLIPFVIWLSLAIAKLPAMDYAAARQWVAQPVNGVLLTTAISLLLLHAQAGLKTIIEDYVHLNGAKFGLLLLIRFGFFLMGIASINAIWRIGVGA